MALVSMSRAHLPSILEAQLLRKIDMCGKSQFML